MKYEMRDQWGNIEKRGSFNTEPDGGGAGGFFALLFVLSVLFNLLMQEVEDGEPWAVILLSVVLGVLIFKLIRWLIKKIR